MVALRTVGGAAGGSAGLAAGSVAASFCSANVSADRRPSSAPELVSSKKDGAVQRGVVPGCFGSGRTAAAVGHAPSVVARQSTSGQSAQPKAAPCVLRRAVATESGAVTGVAWSRGKIKFIVMVRYQVSHA